MVSRHECKGRPGLWKVVLMALILLGFGVWAFVRRVRRVEAENDLIAERLRADA